MITTPKHENIFIISFGACLFILTYFTYQLWHGTCCDAIGYIYQGITYASHGIFAKSGFEYIRTYVYPLYLALIAIPSKILHIPRSFSIPFIQTLTYFICTFILYKTLFKKNPTLARFVFAGLCLNIFITPYLIISLSDSFYVDLFILWLTSCLMFFDAKEPKRTLFCAVNLSLLSSLILETRPAGIWVPMVTAILLALYVIQCLRRKEKFPILLISYSIIAFIIPLIPQIIINITYFNHFTVLPHHDIGAMHLGEFGKHALRLGAFISENAPPYPFYYQNPYVIGTMQEQSSYISWYFLYPLNGIGTIFLKFIELFDYNYIFPYPSYSIIFALEPYTRILSTMIFCSGLMGFLYYSFDKTTDAALMLGPKYFPWLCLLFWGGVTLPAVPELRFGLPIMILFIMFTPYLFIKQRPTWKISILCLLIYFSFVATLFYIDEYTTRYMHVISQ
jgi:hypothetical protein